VPQFVSESATQLPAQKLGVAVPTQRRPQPTPSHVGVAPLPSGASGHGVQLVPQVARLKSETHCPLHSWNPTLHKTPHDEPLQVAMPLTGVEQGVQLVPQVETEEFATQAFPQRWNPAAQLAWQAPLTHWGFEPPGGAVHVWHVGPHAVADSGTHEVPHRA
jgi:hypothetical protein